MKVLFFGPLIPPYNGQAIAFTTIFESFKPDKKLLIDIAKYKNSVLNTIYAIFHTIYLFIFHRFSTIYITCSRSKLGFIKDFPLLLFGRWTKKRIVNHLHGADFKRFYQNSRFLKPFIKYAYEYVSVSIVLLDEMKQEFSDFPKMKTVVIENCYSDDFDSKNMTIPIKKMQLLFLSNIMKSKGIIEFMDACEILLQKYPEIEVKIAGSPLGDDEMNLNTISTLFNSKYQILKNQFSDRINYVGIVNGIEKIELLVESSIFILPSYYPAEAYPISIIEAMRTGNAIITTNHNYLPFIVKPVNGIIIQTHSAEAIKNGVESLLNDVLRLTNIQNHNIEEAKHKFKQGNYISKVTTVINTN